MANEVLHWRREYDTQGRTGASFLPHSDEYGPVHADPPARKAVSTTRRYAMEQTNLDIYGAEPIPWSRALDLLDHMKDHSAHVWLATTRPDGRPHLAGV